MISINSRFDKFSRERTSIFFFFIEKFSTSKIDRFNKFPRERAPISKDFQILGKFPTTSRKSTLREIPLEVRNSNNGSSSNWPIRSVTRIRVRILFERTKPRTFITGKSVRDTDGRDHRAIASGARTRRTTDRGSFAPRKRASSPPLFQRSLARIREKRKRDAVT